MKMIINKIVAYILKIFYKLKMKYKYKDYIDGYEEGLYFVTKNEIKIS